MVTKPDKMTKRDAVAVLTDPISLFLSNCLITSRFDLEYEMFNGCALSKCLKTLRNGFVRKKFSLTAG